MTQTKLIKKRTIPQFQKFLLKWYAKEGRILPWRETTDPYLILVSEIMLQQTQVDRVIPKYHAWLTTFPTVVSLAEAQTADVLTYWSGLGYNNRALRLQKCAQMLTSEYNGIFPRNPEELLKLPGIGPYTSRSILIFAFNHDIATVDTNIRRVFIHEFGLPENTTAAELFLFAQQCLPTGRSRDWHNALMDYGATILTARKTRIKARTTQSTFKGSRRWYRGDLLKRLVAGEQLVIPSLLSVWGKKMEFVQDIIHDMESEGLITMKNGKVLLGSESKNL
jgi:A/G-specific adenine glycosylase